MDIWRLLSAIIRRWYIIIPLLVATVVAAVTIGDWVRPEYKASAIIAIVPGKATVQPKAAQPQLANPYLTLDYGTGVIQYSLSSGNMQRDLLAAGLSGTYQVNAVPHSSFISIVVTANDPDLATATGRGLIERARRILAKRQGAIDARTARASIDVLDDPHAGPASVRGHLQALAAVLAVGGIVSVIATVLIDDLLLLRRRRPNREADLEATPPSNGTESAAVKAGAAGTRVDW